MLRSPARTTPRELNDAEILSREERKLQAIYPGEHVAYLDTWSGEGTARRLLREVVAHAPDYGDVFLQLLQQPDEVRRRVSLTYVLNPQGPIEHLAGMD